MMRVAITIGVGLTAGFLAVALAQMELRYAVAAVTAITAATAILCLGSAERASLALLGALALTIPINISSTLFLYAQAANQYVPHVGGAAGFTVSIPLIAAVGILLLQLVTTPEHRIVRQIRLEPYTTYASIFFLTAGVISMIHAADTKLVGFELLRILSIFLLIVLVTNLKERAVVVYLKYLALAVLLQGSLAIAQYASGSTFGLEAFQNVDYAPEQIDYVLVARAAGTMGNANFLAYFLEITLPLIFVLVLTTQRASLRILYLLAFVAGFGGVICTLTRGAWISLPFTLGTVFVLFIGRRMWTMRAAFFGTLLCLALIVVGVIVAPMVIKRITADDAGSQDSRAPLNAAAWSMIEQFPVTGVGLNNFGDAFPRYDQHGGARMLRTQNHVVHNMYLLIWGETGIIGLLAFLWFFVAALVLAVSVVRRSPNTQHRAIAAGTALGLIAHMVHGLFDPGFRLQFATYTLIACQIGLLAHLRLSLPHTVPALNVANRPAVGGLRSSA